MGEVYRARDRKLDRDTVMREWKTAKAWLYPS